MRRGARRLFLLACALAPPACSTYGRDETTIVEVHDDAAIESGAPDGDDGSTPADADASDGASPEDADADAGRTAHRAFLTDETFAGDNLASAANADTLCTKSANLHGLAGRFRA